MRALLELLVPSCCDGCGRPSPPPWCDRCEHERAAAAPSRPCPSCGDQRSAGHPCWQGPAPVDRLVTLGSWTGGVARAVARAKLAGRREVLVAAGTRLGRAVVTAAVRVDAVVAVPSDRGRVRGRGVDHTAAMARGVAETLGLPRVAPFAAVRGTTDSVSLAGRTGRGPGGAPVTVVRSDLVAGRRLVVVDDVVTTGATLAATARALHDAGAAGVDAAVVGRAGGHELRSSADRLRASDEAAGGAP